MSRSISELIHLAKNSVGTIFKFTRVADRVDAARMSHTRLRALERPRAMQEPEKAEEVDLSNVATVECAGSVAHLPPFVPFGRPNATPAARVSHYRLAAYVSQLSTSQQLEAASELQTHKDRESA